MAMTMENEQEKGMGKAVFNPIRINPETCIKCNLCDWICPGDLIYKDEGKRL